MLIRGILAAFLIYLLATAVVIGVANFVALGSHDAGAGNVVAIFASIIGGALAVEGLRRL